MVKLKHNSINRLKPRLIIALYVLSGINSKYINVNEVCIYICVCMYV